MARVPDIYEDLHLQYSDNEEFISDTHHVSSSQDSFYTNSSPYQEESCTKLEISEKIHQLNSQDCVDAPVVKKKKEKKKQISESHPITSNYVFNVGSNLDKHKDVNRLMAASKREYTFNSYLTNQTISDQDNRSILQIENHLRAVPIQAITPDGVFDIGRYVTLQPAPNYGMAVTIRIANTQLFVAAKGENEPVELQELPKTPTTLDSTSQFLFYWKTEGNYSTFASLAYPGLFLATDVKDDELVFLAKGLPALTAFLVVDQ
ncbi:interleukin-1 alpha [Sarcophilus harrisii]|uniref:Interleukin-1 n=1 Tax=Sarcophilus harrisii TaxID=9305 RepID=G3W2K5_SARHA|nr:interleukin-1 alpha [Sarcophilus harrisii]